MKVAVIGCGSIGRRHIANLIALGVPAEDIAGYDVSADALAQMPDGVKRGGAVISDKPDALLICTPAGDHVRRILLAAINSVAFFLEKPAVLRVDDLSDELWATKLPHLVACHMRFLEPIKRLKADAEERQGRVTSFLVASDISTWPGGAYASPLHEFGAHEIDLALWMLPGLQLASASRQFRAPMYSVHLRSPDRAWADVFIEPRFGPWREGVLFTDHGEAPTEYGWTVHPDLNDAYRDQLAHFLRVARGEEQSINTLAQARKVVEICEQAEQRCAA